MVQALLEQTKVLRTIMSHFHSTSTDPMSDLSSSTPTTGIKGTMAREKLQRDLSNGSGQFFLKVCQAIQRRMSPTSRPASDLSEVAGISLLAYLERYGGYGQSRELGMVQWSLGLRIRRGSCGRSGPRARSSRFDCSYGGTGQFGSECLELGVAPSALGRPASELVVEQGPNSDRGQETFCSHCARISGQQRLWPI